MKIWTLLVISIGCGGGATGGGTGPGGGGGGGGGATVDAGGSPKAPDAAVVASGGGDAPVGAPDAAMPGQPDAQVVVGGGCSLIGSWKGTINNGTTETTWSLGSDGTTQGTFGSQGSAVMFSGPYSVSDGILAFSSTSCTPSSACSCHGVGRYSLDFSSDCNTVTTHYVSEECPGRQSIIDGMTISRQ
jgi:hypothetical protein